MNDKRNNGGRDQGTGYDQTRTGGQEYQNIETSVNNPRYFDEEYANQQEDEMASQEPRTEDEGETGKN